MRIIAIALSFCFLLSACTITTSRSITTATSSSSALSTRSSASGINTSTGIKTFSSARYHYSIQYPSNWYVDSMYSEKNFSGRGTGREELIGGDTVFSSYPNPGSFNPSNAPTDLTQVTLLIYKVSPSTTIRQFLKEKYFVTNKTRDVMINGRKGAQSIVTNNDGHDTQDVITIVAGDSAMFVFSYSPNPLSLATEETDRHIVQSFTLSQ